MLGNKAPTILLNNNPHTMSSRTPNPSTYTREAPNAGIGLFAAKDFASGEVIFRVTRPLVSALDSPHLKDTCYNCYSWLPEDQRDGEDEESGPGVVRLKACTGCRVARYCGKVGSFCCVLFTYIFQLVYLCLSSVFLCLSSHFKAFSFPFFLPNNNIMALYLPR